MEIRINNKYKLQKKIGSGSFGDIYQVVNTQNNEVLAVKLEPIDTQHPQLSFESKIYSLFHNDKNCQGIPKVHYTGTEGEYNVMVMDLLGKSLEDLFIENKKKFDLKTVCMLADQMIQRVQFMHSKGFIHRDIKPDNFLVGRDSNQHRIYMVDFGLAKKYLLKNNVHIPYRENKNLTGTARYASRNTHLGVEQSRRDDMESLGYVFIYFLKGSLPWQNQQGKNRNEKYEKIKEKKISTPNDMLCKGLPNELLLYMQYCQNIRFEDQPDYQYLRGLIKEIMNKNQWTSDNQFCFSQKTNSPVQQNQMKTEMNEQELKQKKQELERLQEQEEKLRNYVKNKEQTKQNNQTNKTINPSVNQTNKSSFIKSSQKKPSMVKKQPTPQEVQHQKLLQMQQQQATISGPKIVKYK